MFRYALIPRALIQRCWHITLVVCAIVLGASGSVCFAADTVAVLLSERGGHYSEYFDALTLSLAELNQPPARTIRVIELQPASSRERPDDALLAGVSTIVAVGVPAMRVAAAWENVPPVLNVMVPRASYDKLVAETGRLRRRVQFSAIYLDQPLVRQLNLIRQIFPGKKRVSAVIGPDSAVMLPRLRSALARAGLGVAIEEVGSEPEILPALSRLLPASDVFLALPDSVVFTRETARSVLLATYRYQKPLIGFSQAYVNAGALAAVFSTPAQIARQTLALLQALPAGRAALPLPVYPGYFSVAVNRSVARALALDIVADAVLQAAVDAMPEAE